MQTWQSWAIFLAIAGAAYWYYNQNSNASERGRSTTRTPITGALKDSVQWSDSDKKPKAQKQAKAKAPRKSVKSAVQEVGNKVEAALTTAAPTSDADDDLSPVASPVAPSNKTPSGKDVSDMLGSQRATPAVLSLKPADKPARTAKPQLQKTESTQETKKQRQNRKKVEEAKAAREEEEKQRQALLEKQRRTAREARGEAAKNGLQQANAPASNAWTTVPTRGAVQPAASAPTGQLLDTFEGASTGSISDAPTNGTAQTAASLNGLPSEEEQLRLAMEDSAWTTVPKGGKKTRKTVNEELMEESNNSVSVEQAPQPVKAIRPTQASKPENQKPSSRYQILSEDFTPSHPQDSDWPVV
ncbi:hypothetical protein T440DRAFT_107779 [Plenodomus tracheiphilus IPT5]|uniref:Uncharacterized protein n=1 Tax=Plenodomus tracheiphilus IPT5 TaxID=1408161 RepID=A0A6A7BLZ1_9PLEO|nr:hypothetical protein T440DRAFT_107779 [Plenodomus tracheiphilus IPT5]